MKTEDESARAERLIRESIAKWEAKVAAHKAGQNYPIDGDDCPLCGQYRKNRPYACEGCPVAAVAGSPNCRGTPYARYAGADPGSPERLAALATDEVVFLKSLLPKEEPKEVTELPTGEVLTFVDASKQYVISSAGMVSYLGYEVARDHAKYIAEELGRPELALLAEEYGTAAGYRKYKTAVAAWCASPERRRTYFGPGVPAEVEKVLSEAVRSNRPVRLVLGDPTTGIAWLEEHDVVGTIGRSSGGMKVPLLCPPGELGGGAILCANVLGVMDMSDGAWLYRHPLLTFPKMSVTPLHSGFQTFADGTHVATFDTAAKAFAYAAFMAGAWVDPKAFNGDGA